MTSMENEGEPKQETLRAAVLRKFSEYCMTTSAHGYGRLIEAKGIIMKIFWICTIASVNGIFIWQLCDRVLLYNVRPTTSIIKEASQLNQSFPQVTICNLNRIRKSKLPAKLLQMFPDILRPSAPTIHKNISSNIINNKELPGVDDYYPIDYLKQKFEYELSKYLEDTLVKAGHQFTTLVHRCTFKQAKCSWHKDKIWNQFWHPVYGNCFVFNSGTVPDGNKTEILKTTNGGPRGGLSLELNIEQDEYMGKVSDEIGVQIQISSQGEKPFPYEEGISVQTGASVKLGMKKEIISHLDPFRNFTCRDEDDIEALGTFYIKQFAKYHPTACNLNCLAEIQRNNCKCVQYEYSSERDKVCSVLNTTIIECLEEALNLYESGYCATKCVPRCRREEFRVSLSTASWPSLEYQEILFTELQEKQGNKTSKSTLANNMLKLSIYFEDLSVRYIEETPAYDVGSLISDIGGVMGMCIGVSFLSCAEVMVLLAGIFARLWKGFKQRGRTGKNRQNVINVQPTGITA